MNSAEDVVVASLKNRGVLSAKELAAAMKVSQSTISRSLSAMRGSEVLRLGRARSTRYALSRHIAGLGQKWPLYQIDQEGHSGVVGQLHALEMGQWCLEQDEPWDTMRGAEFRDGLFPGLPWFLDDLRPRGFLGRCLARSHATLLGAPADPRVWHADHVAGALLRLGEDLPGSFVLGEAMLEGVQRRSLRTPDAMPVATRESTYPQQADGIMQGPWPGSSAAGEQPKFLACLQDPDGSFRHVIVKFCGPTDRADNERWADLLRAEHEANKVLSEHDLPCASTEIIESNGRIFLESTRFDRKGAWGRCGMISLESLDAAFFGEIETPWTAAADRLLQSGWITELAARRLSILWWFGTLIGNTDMHYGNASFFFGPHKPLVATPTYDMVPMHYRPNIEGSASGVPITPPPPPPDALEEWCSAAIMAENFWQRLCSRPGFSSAFRTLAEKNAEVLFIYRQRFTKA